VEALLARLVGLVKEALQGDLAEQGGQGVGVLAAAAVAVAVLTQPCRRLRALFGLQPVELPLQEPAGQLARLPLELLLQVVGGLGGDGPAAELLEQLAELLQAGQQGLQQGLAGEQGLQPGACQQPQGQRRVVHGGVLSR
jgi:hypothetical protein